MPQVGIASVSRMSADAGAQVADEGGNAVDAAISAALVSVITHPGMCSVGSGGFITIWPPEGRPLTVDGGSEMPGRELPAERFGGGLWQVQLEYGGGVATSVGPGAVATPGALAACDLANRRWGRLRWGQLVEPARERASQGFPLPASSHHYLTYAHELIYGWDPRSFAVLHDASGELKSPGAEIKIPDLAESLRTLAEEGVEAFYQGEIGRRVAEHLQAGGGILTHGDLTAYEPRVRPALEVELDGWRVATNPPPAIGGTTLAAMLLLMQDRPCGAWTPADVEHLIHVQRSVLGFRRRRLDVSTDRAEEARRLLDAAAKGLPFGGGGSASTLHTSAVDSEGLACAVTLSDGYGSGVMPPGTGFWLNNCLGEPELNRRGTHAWPAGSRLPSNMAPTVGRGPGGEIVAIGSPGADRITTAILETLLNFMRLGMTLEKAVTHPRLHVELPEEGASYRIVHEAGMPVPNLSVPIRCFDGPAMFFGGVEAAVWAPETGFDLAADARRAGGTAVGGQV